MSAEYNIFLASPRGSSDLHVQSAKTVVDDKFSAAISHATVKVVTADEEWARSFSQSGSWDAWTTHVASGVDYEFRTPLYNAIVCTTEKVGKATADIVEKALGNRRMVALVMDSKITQVIGVESVDSDNWQSGWRLTLDT
ncbi:MAG: hypothetical protein KAJ42_00740 [Gemmatimonadetes bacterium]|nr:hypothetical protein [Gemmatimonadota bacterium]